MTVALAAELGRMLATTDLDEDSVHGELSLRFRDAGAIHAGLEAWRSARHVPAPDLPTRRDLD